MKNRKSFLPILTVLLLGLAARANPTLFPQTALLAANMATNQLDNSWTPQWSSLKAYWRMDGKAGATANAYVMTDLFGTANATASGAGRPFVTAGLGQRVASEA